MASPGEQTFKLHKMDDRTALDLVLEVKGFLGIQDDVRIRILHGFEYNHSQLPEDSIKTGQYLFSQMAVHGAISEVGSTVRGGFEFSRFPNGQVGEIDKNFDYFTFRLNNESGNWASHIEKLLEVINIVTAKDLPVVATSSDVSETYRAQLLSQDAIHRRMLEDLNKSITDMAVRRAEMEEKAAADERQRKEIHEAAQRELEEQKALLERQSYMATRRRIGQSIRGIMTDPNRQAARNHRQRSVFAGCVFLAYMALGGAGAYGTYHSLVAYEGNRAIELATEKVRRMFSEERSISEALAASGLVLAKRETRSIDGGEVPILSEVPFSETPTFSNQMDFAIDRAISGSLDASKLIIIAKIILSTLVSVFGFVSAATWMRRHLENETRLDEEKLAFVADVERASWVIEAIHEVKAEAQSELPKEWIDAVTHNLFASRQSTSDLDDGAQAVRALLGLAAGAKVGPQGLEVELNRRGTKALGATGE